MAPLASSTSNRPYRRSGSWELSETERDKLWEGSVRSRKDIGDNDDPTPRSPTKSPRKSNKSRRESSRRQHRSSSRKDLSCFEDEQCASKTTTCRETSKKPVVHNKPAGGSQLFTMSAQNRRRIVSSQSFRHSISSPPPSEEWPTRTLSEKSLSESKRQASLHARQSPLSPGSGCSSEAPRSLLPLPQSLVSQNQAPRLGSMAEDNSMSKIPGSPLKRSTSQKLSRSSRLADEKISSSSKQKPVKSPRKASSVRSLLDEKALKMSQHTNRKTAPHASLIDEYFRIMDQFEDTKNKQQSRRCSRGGAASGFGPTGSSARSLPDDDHHNRASKIARRKNYHPAAPHASLIDEYFKIIDHHSPDASKKTNSNNFGRVSSARSLPSEDDDNKALRMARNKTPAAPHACLIDEYFSILDQFPDSYHLRTGTETSKNTGWE